jgi:hypothetical protein
MLRRKLFLICLVLLLGVVGVFAVRTPRAAASITLLSFTATSLNDKPEIFVKWETATEIGTAGFYVQRSLTNTASSFTNASPFMSAEGGSLTGSVYDWLDDTTTLNTAYYYRLLEVPSNAAKPPVPYDSVWVMAGVAATATPLPATATATQPAGTSPTNTPTTSPGTTPTVTPTTRPGTTPTNTPVVATSAAASATPRTIAEATVTPFSAAGDVGTPPITTSSGSTGDFGTPVVQPPSSFDATALPGSLSSAPGLTAPTPEPNSPVPSGEIAVVPATPVLAPTLDAPVVEQPVVVVTEAAASTAKPAESRTGVPLLIIGAAVVLLVGAFLLLRQASK